MSFEIRTLEPKDIPGAVALQRACFPAPFPEELLWSTEHLERHHELFPDGQFVAIADGKVLASASSTLISEATWERHTNWEATVGGPFLKTFDRDGTTLYGLDISVHPNFRGKGIGRLLYRARFDLVQSRALTRFGTACRLPGYSTYETHYPGVSVEEYAAKVASGDITDQTMTPLLRYGLTFRMVIRDYMEDSESANAAALLERTA